MRLPNGYGSVYKLSGNRRRPFVARKTTGFKMNDEKQTAYPIYQIIGYFEKREQALTALADFNKNPYSIESNKITFSEVYNKWSKRKFEEISKSNINGYKASYKVCEPLHNRKFIELKLADLQAVIDNSGKNYPTLKKVKVLFGQLYEYAIINEIIPKERNFVEYVNISRAGNPNAIDRTPFKKSEIKKLWSNVKANEYISVILMLIYSGVRIGELLELKKENINLKEKWFDVTASKTTAGIRRVPIADKTHKFFEEWFNKNDCEYLLSTPDGKQMDYRNYYESYWIPIIEQLGMTHRPHDTRHTCVSLLTAAGVDERIIKKIVGHKGQGVTQAVYTHVEIGELLEEINKI
ncbi:site-specific integrase [Anaerotignum sp.]|uniref:tyrosine-type recombinase/integrase n=1 Tax=Anaerotignum sp. TaxID=2039241 RepID=UPI00331907F7